MPFIKASNNQRIFTVGIYIVKTNRPKMAVKVETIQKDFRKRHNNQSFQCIPGQQSKPMAPKSPIFDKGFWWGR